MLNPGQLIGSIFKSDPSDSIPAEKVLPELLDDTLRPANILCGVRYRKNMTQKELAKQLGISVRRLSEMENAKRPIGKEMAQKLANVLKVDHRKFL